MSAKFVLLYTLISLLKLAGKWISLNKRDLKFIILFLLLYEVVKNFALWVSPSL